MSIIHIGGEPFDTDIEDDILYCDKCEEYYFADTACGCPDVDEYANAIRI